MSKNKNLTLNFEKHKQFAETLSSLIDLEMKSLEAENEISEIIRKFPIVISLVNTFGFLRGQEGAFNGLDFKYEELQAWLRKNETEFENRLYSLIVNKIGENGIQKAYKKRLTEFFVDFRKCRDEDIKDVSKRERTQDYMKAKEYIIGTQRASASGLQAKFGFGYPKANSIMMELEEDSVISELDGNRRTVLIKE